MFQASPHFFFRTTPLMQAAAGEDYTSGTTNTHDDSGVSVNSRAQQIVSMRGSVLGTLRVTIASRSYDRLTTILRSIVRYFVNRAVSLYLCPGVLRVTLTFDTTVYRRVSD